MKIIDIEGEELKKEKVVWMANTRATRNRKENEAFCYKNQEEVCKPSLKDKVECKKLVAWRDIPCMMSDCDFQDDDFKNSREA